MSEANSTAGQLLVTHLLYTVQDPISTARQSSFRKSFYTLLFIFSGPGLSIPDQDCGRDFRGEAESIAGQPLVTHLLYTVQDPISTARQSSFLNSFHTLLCVFRWTKSDSIPDHDCGRDFMDEAGSIASQPLAIHLLYTVQDPISSTRQSSFRKSFHTLLFIFWWTRSKHLRSTLRKRLYG